MKKYKKDVVATETQVFYIAQVPVIKSEIKYFADGHASRKTKNYEYRNFPWLRELVANNAGEKSVLLAVRQVGAANPAGKAIVNSLIAAEDRRDDLISNWARDRLDGIAAEFRENIHA
jgi:hypothetical protein